jgi:hypothetical protein
MLGSMMGALAQQGVQIQVTEHVHSLSLQRLQL